MHSIDSNDKEIFFKTDSQSFLYITLGIYQTALNMIPSNIASLIVIGGFCFILERKLWKFLLIIVLAMQMHQSVFIFIALYILHSIKLTRFRAVLLFGAGGIVLMLYDRLLPVISLFVPDVYQRYLMTSQITNGVVFGFHILIFIFILVVTDFRKAGSSFNLYLWAFIMELEFYWLSFRLEIFPGYLFVQSCSHFTCAICDRQYEICKKQKTYQRDILYAYRCAVRIEIKYK
ncbi:EpsG family protein [[Clostridium] hylemonae]|uniref:EpsG family protein n=1 Tax=[Clostridium] hylemonae TaxID=89153 RepID=UPI003A7F5037